MDMTVHSWLKQTQQQLATAGITTARLDSLVLLEDCLRTNRAHLLAHPETVLTDEQITELGAKISRRRSHEPLAYIRGQSEFYGRVFTINNNVLEPRPESEMMIDMLLALSLPRDTAIVDVGTGSGALAITAKCELHHNPVMAIDIDPACLDIARQNAQRLQAGVTFYEGDLLDPIGATLPRPAVLLCNLPYVPDSLHINQAASHEPRLAIFGGTDGLDLYRKLFGQIGNLDKKPRYILTESMPSQHTALSTIAAQVGYSCSQGEDFIQLFERP